MVLKPACRITHGQISSGTCPWCNAELSSDSVNHRTAIGRNGKCQWDLDAMETALEDGDEEARSTTVSNLRSNCGPGLRAALPLLAKAMEDDELAIRESAEKALHALGRRMSADDAKGYEAEVLDSYHEHAARILLLVYYFGKHGESTVSRDARHRHVLWLIRNAPDSLTAGLPFAEASTSGGGQAYSQARKLWLEQVQRHPGVAKIAGNAARFFTLHDKEASEALLRKAKELEPDNPEWPVRLGRHYMLQVRGDGNDPGGLAGLALQEFKEAEQLRSRGASIGRSTEVSEGQFFLDNFERSNALQRLARAALEAGDLVDARHFASELLAMVENEDLASLFERDGNAIHHGNLVLGRCEMREGNVEQAKAHLLASGRIPGAPNLSSFGPNMSLAKELLDIGEQEVVLEYYELCKDFWKSEIDRLEVWADVVKRGEVPVFGANMKY